MANLESIPCKADGVMGRIVDGEAVLVLPVRGQVKVLNEVGAFIWSNVNSVNTVRVISDLIMAEYNVDQANAEKDTLSFLHDLEDRGVVHFS